MNIFILEDEAGHPPRNQLLEVLKAHKVTLARNVPEAITLYPKNRPYDMLLLDHDMGGFFENPEAAHGNTGTAFVKWLVANEFAEGGEEVDFPDVILHSQNPEGRKAMSFILRDAGFDVQQIPFGPVYIDALRKI